MERDDCMINTNQIIQGAESREKSKGAHYLEVSNDRMDELDYARPLDLTVPIPMEHDRDVEERGIDDLDRGGGELEHGRADLEQGRGDLAHGRDDLEHGRAELDRGGGDLEQGLVGMRSSLLVRCSRTKTKQKLFFVNTMRKTSPNSEFAATIRGQWL